MKPRHWIELIAVLLGTLGLLAPSALGGPGSGPVASIACAGAATGDCSESGNISLPPNTSGSESTDVVPDQSTSGSELVEPFSTSDLADFDQSWETIVAGFPSLGGIHNTFVRRVLTCAIFAKGASAQYKGFAAEDTQSALGTDTYHLFLTLCIQLVVTTQELGPTPEARAASGGCALAKESLPIMIKRTGRTYTVQVASKPQAAKGKTSLAVSCRPQGSGLLIGLRPSARRQKLHQVIGSHMSIGFSNPTSGPVTIKTTFGFKR